MSKNVKVEVVSEVVSEVVTETKSKKTVKTGVGKEILRLIAENRLTNKEIVAKVLSDNPERRTTYSCVAWYRSKVRSGQIDLPKVETLETID